MAPRRAHDFDVARRVLCACSMRTKHIPLLIVVLSLACTPAPEISRFDAIDISSSADGFLLLGTIGTSRDGIVTRLDEPHDAVLLTSTDAVTWRQEIVEGVGVPWAAATDGEVHIIATHQTLLMDDGQGVGVGFLLRKAPGGEIEAIDVVEHGAPSSIAFGNGRFVVAMDVLGESEADGVLISDDGRDWRAVEVGPAWWFPRVRFGAGAFWLFGEGEAVARSTDGETWQVYTTGLTLVDGLGFLDDEMVALGTYDCCFHERPDLIQQFTLRMNGDELVLTEQSADLRGTAALVEAPAGLLRARSGGIDRASLTEAGTLAFDEVHGASDDDIYYSAATFGDVTYAVGFGAAAFVRSSDGGASWQPTVAPAVELP